MTAINKRRSECESGGCRQYCTALDDDDEASDRSLAGRRLATRCCNPRRASERAPMPDVLEIRHDVAVSAFMHHDNFTQRNCAENYHK